MLVEYPTLSTQLNLFVYPTKDLIVTVAYGQKVEEVAKCHKVSIQIQELDLQTEIYALPLEEMDI